MKTYSTGQVAKEVGVSKLTLVRWLVGARVKGPRKIKHGGVEIRIWTDRDVERVREFKQQNYRKGRGRKPKQKRSKNGTSR